MSPVVTFFLWYFMLLLASTIVINGWFLITRGEERVMPDGSVIRTGNIFKAWYFFWMRTRDTKKKFWYNRANAEEFMFHVKQKYTRELRSGLQGISSFDMSLLDDDPLYGTGVMAPASIRTIQGAIEKGEDLKLAIEDISPERTVGLGDMVDIRIYQEEDRYVFPEWIRKPLAGCITCHSSIYGLLCFILFHLAVDSSFLHTEMYGFAPYDQHPQAIVATAIAFCFSLSYSLTWMYKRL